MTKIYIKVRKFGKNKGANMKNWCKEDILCELKKKGWSVRRLAREWNLSASSLHNALRFPYPRGERIIAAAIGIEPEKIWAERYEKRKIVKVTDEMRKKVDSNTKIDNGYLSIKQLLALNNQDLPLTARGIKAKADRENWHFVECHSRGRNGKTRFYSVSALPIEIQSVVNAI